MRHTALVAQVLSLGLAGASPASALAQAAPPPAPPGACEDFYRHANSEWLADAEAAASPFAALASSSLARQRALLDGLAPDAGDAGDRLLATFWRAANDAAAIEASGLVPLHGWLQRVESLRRASDVASLLAQAHAAGLPLLFRFEAGADLREPRRRTVYALQGGLGLPDRDYYLRTDPATQALLGQYRAYVARLLTLAGTPQARLEADVAAILDMETRLARASLSLLQLRDPNNSWRPTDVRELGTRFGHMDWPGFLRAQELRRLRTLSMAHTAFFVEADHLVGALPVAQWRAYLRFHLLHALAPQLTQDVRDAHFALFGRELRGLDQPPPRWQQALQATDRNLGEWLGQRYAARHLDAATEQRAHAVAGGVLAALQRRLAAADWLGEEARGAGAAKLAALELAIGHADPPPAGAPPRLAADQHVANLLALAGWRHRQALARLDAPAPPAALPGHRVNAFYDPAGNRLAVSAALLAPPLLDPQADPARDHGSLGALLGHELWHAVDAQGATVDANGAVRSWWSAEDFQRFAERTRVLSDRYASYPALGEVRVDGRRTFLENLADLAGLSLAWDAWQATDPHAGDVAAQQRFFQAYAQLWRRRMDLGERRLQLATGVHAPPRWRVLGPLANFAPFAQAYGCAAEGSFVLPAGERLELWH